MEQCTIINPHFTTMATKIENFNDVTLITAENKKVKSQKVILCTYSKFFKNIFLDKSDNKNQEIYLHNIFYKELCWILDFIYLGQCNLEQTDIDRFQCVGKFLEVQGIMEEDEEKTNEHSVSTTGNFSEGKIEETCFLETETYVKTETDEHISENTIKEETCNLITEIQVKTEIEDDNDKYQLEYSMNAQSDDLDTDEREISFRDIPNVAKNELGKYPCTHCDYQASCQGNIKIHILSVHKGARYKCGQCDYQGTTQRNVKAHKLAVHEGFKYNCDQCDYQGTQPGNLKRHKLNVHEGVKYSCEQCDFQGTTPGSLNRHKLSIHEGVKYNCEFCGMQFGRPYRLKNHIQKKHQ